MGILTHDDILKLHAAVISAQLVASRSALLTGINGNFVAGLRDADNRAEQILQDLNAMNETGELANGGIPLATWLRNALACASGKKETAVFADALDRCEAAKTPASLEHQTAYAQVMSNAFRSDRDASPLSDRAQVADTSDIRRHPVKPIAAVPIGLRPPIYVPRGRSQRLDTAADQVLALVDAGTRLVVLRAQPGEGKTQVLRQIADLRNGYYVELGDRDDPSTALREGLSFVVESFGDPSCADRSLPVVCATVRSILYRQRADPLLVLDALDAPCTRATLESLLDAQLGGAVIVAGPGATGILEVSLAPADEHVFNQVFNDALVAQQSLSSAECDLLAKIGAAVGFSPLGAEFVAEVARSQDDLHGSLAAHLEEIEANDVDLDVRTRASLTKLWRHLSNDERTRVALVAILGEPGLPLSWLPVQLRVSVHTHLRLLTMTTRGPERYLEAHRLVANFARREGTPLLRDVLVSLLEAWAGDERLMEELKARGVRSRALIRGFRYLRNGVNPGSVMLSPRLTRAYVDAANSPTPALLLEHMSFVVNNAEEVATLSLEVLGEVAEQIPPGIADQNDELRAIRTASIDRLLGLARSDMRLTPDDDEPSRALASAMHHAAKALLKTKDRENEKLAVERLTELEQRCITLLSSAPGSRRLLIELAQIRLQIARSALLPAVQRTTKVREVLQIAGTALPTYLRLALSSAALDVQGVSQSREESLDMVRQGLALCTPHTIVEAQANFLRAAVGACDRIAAEPAIWSEITEKARTLAGPLAADVLGDRGVASLGHALVKSASLEVTRQAAELILGSLALYDIPVEAAGPAVLGRLGAAMREIGLPREAADIARVLYDRRPSSARYHEAFDLAKALRAAGEYELAISVVQKEQEEQRRRAGGHRNAAPLNDEFAKSAVRLPSREVDARNALEENVRLYRELGLTVYADRCARWLSTLGSDPVLEGAIADDEWRAMARGNLLKPEERSGAVRLAQRAVARVRNLGTS